MKLNPWTLPISAAILCGMWMIYSSHRTAEMERLVRDLGEQLQRSKQLAADQAKRKLADEQAGKKAEKRIDWQKMSVMAQGNPSFRDGYELMRLQERLKSMNADELLAQLDEIEKMDLSSELKMRLRELLFSPLAKLAPEFACKRYADCLSGEGQVRTYFPFTYKSWFQKDPVAATAWLDQQIQEGRLESKSLKPDFSTRAALESTVLSRLISSDPAAATERASKMPEELKKQLFHEFYFNGTATPESGSAYVAMARAVLSKEDAPAAIGAVIAGFIGKGSDFSRVDQFMAEINTSPEEKRATVTKGLEFAICGEGWNMDRLTKATSWVQSHQPDEVEEITGAAISMAAQETRSFDKALKLVQAYQEKSGRDAVLIAFLERGAADQTFALVAKGMIQSIKDPAKRAGLEALFAR